MARNYRTAKVGLLLCTVGIVLLIANISIGKERFCDDRRGQDCREVVFFDDLQTQK